MMEQRNNSTFKFGVTPGIDGCGIKVFPDNAFTAKYNKREIKSSKIVLRNTRHSLWWPVTNLPDIGKYEQGNSRSQKHILPEEVHLST